MKLSEYRHTHSWQEAIALGPQLARLAEELPAAEEHGLSLQLRQLMVELPATVAADLIQDHKPTLAPVLRLNAALELIDHVYPALDTAATRAALDHILERLVSQRFDERADQAAGDLHAGVTSDLPNPGETPHAHSAAVPQPAKPEPGSVPVVPAEPGPAAPPVTVPVQAADQTPQDHPHTDVHPDSLQ